MRILTFISKFTSDCANIDSVFPCPPNKCAHKYTQTWKTIFSQSLLHQVVLKLALGSRDHTDPGNSERQKEFDHIVKDFDPTEEGETSEEAHCASNKTQLCLSCHLHEYTLAFVLPPMRCNVWIQKPELYLMSPWRPFQSHCRWPCQRKCTQPPVEHASLWQLKEKWIYMWEKSNLLKDVDSSSGLKRRNLA